MASCPKCQTELGEQDFGLIQCPGCGTSLMIDLDGSVEASAAEPKHSEPAASTDVSDLLGEFDESREPSTSVGGGEAERMLRDPENWATDGLSDPSVAAEGIDQNTHSRSYKTGEVPTLGEQTGDIPQTTGLFSDQDVMEGSDNDHFAEDEIDTSDEIQEVQDGLETDSEPDLEPKINHEETSDDHYDGEYQQGDEVYSASDSEASIDEIQKFGNSDVSQTGAINYTLRIGRIDSAEVREEVWEVLADKRLMLDVDEIFSRISEGELVLGEVSAVKAYVVLSQLIGVAVSLDWSQHVEAQP